MTHTHEAGTSRAAAGGMALLQTAFGVAPVTMLLMLLVAALGTGVALERAVVVARSRLSGHGRPFIERLVAMVQAAQIDEALASCSGTQAILPDIGLLVLRTRIRGEADLEAVMDAAVRSTTPRLSRRLRYLPALAILLVLLGGGGSLAAAALRVGAASRADLAPAAIGLLAAGPLLLAHAFLANQVEAILAQVGEFSRRLSNALLDRPDVRLGHR